MSQVGDMFLWGVALGTSMGGVLGYATHACVAWSRKHKDEVKALNSYKPYNDKVKQRGAPLSVPTFVSLPEHKQEQRLRVVRSEPSEHHPDRGVVLDALTSAGYKKQQATLAVDACSGPEKATVESWTVAALRRAAGK